jgi:hypothetical protein
MVNFITIFFQLEVNQNFEEREVEFEMFNTLFIGGLRNQGSMF